MFIQDEKNCLVWRATLAIAAGLLLGGGAASIENHACARSETAPTSCLSEAPRVRVLHGMIGGVFASGGALMMIELLGKSQKID